MALPPGRIRIKRRREDEPVETLYIQSDIHQSKRRFTDYVFQRVPRTENGASVTDDSTAGKLTTKNHRAVSTGGSLGVARTSSGVPIVKAPTAGDQLTSRRRPPKLQMQSQKEDIDSTGIETGSPPLSSSSAFSKVISPTKRASGSGAIVSRSTTSPSLRHFHISTPTAGDDEDSSSSVLHRVGGGIQKKRSTKLFGRGAVVVEKTPNNPLAAKADPVLAKAAASAIGTPSAGGDSEVAAPKDGNIFSSSPMGEQGELKPSIASTKRHVVNDAEKKWKAQRKESRYTDRVQQTRERSNRSKKGESVHDDPSNWNYDSERLADELAQVALEMTNDAEIPNASTLPPIGMTTPPPRPAHQRLYKPTLKYQPRLPKGQRERQRHSRGRKGGMRFDGGSDSPDKSTMEVDQTLSDVVDERAQSLEMASEQEKLSSPPPAIHENSTDSAMDDTAYIYDEFIRRRIHELDMDSRMTYLGNGKWSGGHEKSSKDIGVVVITNEDVHHWDAFAEDEEKDWDTEDEDSNAEDNPANEYPDEDLDFDDEYNDTNALYRRFRCNASDDEEYDLDEYDEYGYRTFNGNDSDELDD